MGRRSQLPDQAAWPAPDPWLAEVGAPSHPALNSWAALTTFVAMQVSSTSPNGVSVDLRYRRVSILAILGRHVDAALWLLDRSTNITAHTPLPA